MKLIDLKSKTAKGFTLVEIMIVMTILAIILSTVSLASKPNISRQLNQDAEYLGDVLDYMQEEAQARGNSLVISIGNKGLTTNAKGNNNLLNKYKWDVDDIYITSGWIKDKNTNKIWHRVVTTEPFQTPYKLYLVKENKKIQISGDGSGRYKVSDIMDINE